MHDARAATLIALCHRRWAMPILAVLDREHGAKMVTLVHRLGASPAAVRQSLDHLIDHGWAAPNPGYGHPLRPEYVIPPAAAGVARAVSEVERRVRALGVEDLAARKWSLPVLWALADAGRFAEIRRALPGLGDRALSAALEELRAANLVDRVLLPERPPAWRYRPGPRARGLRAVLDRI